MLIFFQTWEICTLSIHFGIRSLYSGYSFSSIIYMTTNMRFWVTKTYSSRSNRRLPSVVSVVETTWTALCPASSTSPLVRIFLALALSLTLLFTRRKKSSRKASTWKGIRGPLPSIAEASMARRRPFSLFSPRSTATGLIPRGYSCSSVGTKTLNPFLASVKETTSSLPATASVTGNCFSVSATGSACGLLISATTTSFTFDEPAAPVFGDAAFVCNFSPSSGETSSDFCDAIGMSLTVLTVRIGLVAC